MLAAIGLNDGKGRREGRDRRAIRPISSFLKQALTIGLAGLAGTAAFFTDTSKIPSDSMTIGAIIVMGLMLLATVGASLMGLSTYANLLKARKGCRDRRHRVSGVDDRPR